MTDAAHAVRAVGLLREFNQADVLTSADVHVATTLGRLTGERDDEVLLAIALAVRAVRQGAVCVDLAEVRRTAAADVPEAGSALPWPEAEPWLVAVSSSGAVAVGVDGPADRPVRVVDGLVYLDRYWRQEQLIRAELDARAGQPLRAVDGERLRDTLALLFEDEAPNHQRLAAAACALGHVTVIAGGPGTGKTTTIARMVALLIATWPTPPRVALAAPTGKAAARLTEAFAAQRAALAVDGLPTPPDLEATTLHRLLGWRPDSRTRFRHDRSNRLPFDVVVVDETSMVSLTLMSRLLEAVRSDAALVLVGDPDQLASVEAGAVLGDLVLRPERSSAEPRLDELVSLLPEDTQPRGDVAKELRNDVVRLRTVRRFGAAIGALAEAIRLGHVADALAVLHAGDRQIEFVETPVVDQPRPGGLDEVRDDVVRTGRDVHAAAAAGEVRAALAALDRHRLLCAHRRGPYGVARWSRDAEAWLAAAIPGYGEGGEWYVGRPLIITSNDYEARLFNGDTGVVVDVPGEGLRAAFSRGGDATVLPVNRLPALESVHAMTVHRGQGSQFQRVTVLLPPPDSPLLTRELFYTAVTRAEAVVRVVASEDSVRAAIEQRVVRPSGLRRR